MIQPPEVEPQPPRRVLTEILVCLGVAVLIAGLGAPLGLLWRAIAPKVELVQTVYGVYPLDEEPEGYVADDGWFIFLAVAMGILLAVLTWMVLRRFRGPGMLVALVAGSIGCAVLAAWLGNHIGYAAYVRLATTAPPGTHILRPPKARMTDVGLWFGFIPRVRGIVLLQGLIAAALYTAFAGFNYSSSLQHEAVSSDWTEPQIPTGGPESPEPAPAVQPPGAASPAPPEAG
jgi:hypothetical protein